MAKKMRLPKKIAGYKVPKRVRKSKVLRKMLSSPVGRDVLAKVLTAGAGAAAAVLVGQRDEVSQAGKKGAKKGLAGMNAVTEAIQGAAKAMGEVLTDSARSVLPQEQQDDAHPKQPAVSH